MKKESFDDKIREKLQGHAVQPSTAAYAKLQSRMAAQGGSEKKGFYLWYGAAAASLALLLGFFALQNTGTTETSLADKKTAAKSQSLEKGQSELAVTLQNTEKTQETVKNQTENMVLAEKKADTSERTKTSLQKNGGSKKEEKAVSEQKTSFIPEPAQSEKENLTEKDGKPAKEESIFSFEDDKADLAFNEAKKEETLADPQDLSVEIVIGNGQNEQQGPTGVKKYKNLLIKQIKNARKGEGVDKNILGEKAQWLLAVATSWRED